MKIATEKTKKYKPYSEYKDSGVDWLGDVPNHWGVRKLKYISDVRPSNVDKKSVEGELPVKLCNYIDVYSNDHITSEINFMNATASQSQIKRFSLKHGDVLITKDSEAWDDIAVPAYITENFPGVLCGYHLAHISPNQKRIYGKYLLRAFSSFPIRDQFCVAANGITRFGLSKNSISSGLFLIPPLDEQRAIADFLDRRAGQIDELIAKKERVIELLREKRTALISHAVTKGLNPDAKMKDSGVEWLGKMPEHWKGMSLKRWVKIKITDGPHETPELVDNGVPFVSAEAVRNGKINFDAIRGYISHALHKQYIKKCHPRKNDIFMIKSGATTGNLALVEAECEFSIWSPLALIRANEEKILPKYLFLSLHADYAQNQVQTLWSFGTQQNIGMGIIERLYVIAPSVKEQQIIADFLDSETSKIDALIAKVTEAIEKLKEYRTALISAVVTGKIKIC